MIATRSLFSSKSVDLVCRSAFQRRVVRELKNARSISTVDIDRRKGDKERVVILGSGWAGFTLSRRLSPKKYQVVVVSPRSYFAFTPLLNSTASGTLEFRTAIEPVRNKRRPHIDFIQGWADDINLTNKTVVIEENLFEEGHHATVAGDGRDGHAQADKVKVSQEDARKKGELLTVPYDKLIVAVGCYNNTFGTKGVKEHALFLKDITGARALRNRILECFEVASLPTTHAEVKKQLLHFAIVGGGPTGMEFAAELSDLIRQDLIHLYPSVKDFIRVTVYDVAERVLSMFDQQLVDFAMKTYKREGIKIKTSHHVEELRPGLPTQITQKYGDIAGAARGYTLRTKEDGETGIGLCLWSTGNMMNPFVQRLQGAVSPPKEAVRGQSMQDAKTSWQIAKHPKSGALLVDSHLRLQLSENSGTEDNSKKTALPSVFALGDNAKLQGPDLPVTAQTANQQAIWLAKRLNQDDFDKKPGFTFKNLGILTYLGSYKGLMQRNSGPGKALRGYSAWLLWRGAYLTMSVSWRNKILIPVYWFLTWAFGRDISRF